MARKMIMACKDSHRAWLAEPRLCTAENLGTSSTLYFDMEKSKRRNIKTLSRRGTRHGEQVLSEVGAHYPRARHR
jgi:hypothetical protein